MEQSFIRTGTRHAKNPPAVTLMITGLLLLWSSVPAIAGTGSWNGSHSGATLLPAESTELENRDDAEEMENDTLYVLEFLLARDVVEREPVDVVDSYTIDDSRAWCFARIHNSQKMQNVYFEWHHEGELYFRMNARVGTSNNWRTYSSVGLQPGQWRVLLRDRHGTILDERTFEVAG